MKFTILTFLLTIFSLTLNAQVQNNSVKFRTDNSDVVIEGRVVKCQSFWNAGHTQIFTSNSIEVLKVFKGNNLQATTIDIITLGGVIDDRFCIVSHQTTFKPGMEGIFFCKPGKKSSNAQSIPETSYVLSFTETGFIQYFFKKFNPPAADVNKSYKDIPNEIYNQIILSAREPVRKIKANTVEEKLQEAINIVPNVENLNSTGISYSFENVSLTNNAQNISFDIFVNSFENGLKFGKSLVLIKYSPEVFGESVIANQNFSITKGTVIQNSAYSLSGSDQDLDAVQINVASNFLSPNAAYTLTTIPEQFCHINLKVENLFALSNIQFGDFEMSENSWYYDPGSKDYVLFDRVAVETPIIKTNVTDPAYIFYHLDSICITSNATKKYLEFDISASSNVAWTRLSIADIFISYNTLGFGSSPTSEFALYPEFSTPGYNTSILPYPAPANLLQITIAQENLSDSTKHVPIGIDPKRIGRMKMEITNCNENAGIYFVDSLMNGLQFYFGGVPIPLFEYEFGEEGNADYYDQFLCVPNAPIITKIYPKDVSAGIRDTLTIEGKGFLTGGGYGSVYFRDADFKTDTMVYSNAYIEDYILFTDTLIKVYVPSNLSSSGSAGSGKIKVENNIGGVATSDEPINVIFSVMNTRNEITDTAYQFVFINQNGVGGYTFEMDGQLEFEGAGPCIKKSIEIWKCLTNVNWSFKDLAEIETQNAQDDDKNIFYIGDTIPPDANGDNFLMRTYIFGYVKTCDSLKNFYYVDNMDVQVNPYYSFVYDCDNVTAGLPYNTFSVLQHELGHCHMLQHNLEDNELMSPYFNPSVISPSFNDILGGKKVIEFSLGWESLGSCAAILKHDTVSCETNFVYDNNNNNKSDIIVYPNPFTEELIIEINGIDSPNLFIDIYDLTGRNIFHKKTDSAPPAIVSVDKKIPPGAYILKIISNHKVFSTVIIKK